MDWCGQIYGTEQNWGAPGASRLIIAGAPDIPGDAATGPVQPEQLTERAQARHLAALGPIPAADRLALIGFQALNPHWDGVAILVGATATIWATLSAREVIHHQGSATPQLVAALGLAEAGLDAVDAGLDRPERLPHLLHDAPSDPARLGALLGAEVGAARTLWLGQQAVLIGDGPLTKAYAQALSAAHVPVTLTNLRDLRTKGFEALAQAVPPDA